MDNKVMQATYSPVDNRLRLLYVDRLEAPEYGRACKLGFFYAPKQEAFVAKAWSPEREDFLIELCGAVGDNENRQTQHTSAFAQGLPENPGGLKREPRGEEAPGLAIAPLTLGLQNPDVGHVNDLRSGINPHCRALPAHSAGTVWNEAGYWKERAARDLAYGFHKTRPSVREERIQALQADANKLQRTVDGLSLTIEKLSADALVYETALQVAALDGNYELWMNIREHPAAYRETCDAYVTVLTLKGAVHYARWSRHYNNRLSYERSMLVGGAFPKTKQTCNYASKAFVIV
jgi:hypothetical protein